MRPEVRLLAPGEERVLDYVAPHVFDHALNPRAIRAFLEDPRHHLAVALHEERVVGFASAVHYVHPDKQRPELWINEVGVATSHRRQGIARELLDALLGRAAEIGCSEAWVLTERSNTAATALYASAGGVAAAESIMFTFPVAPAPGFDLNSCES